MKILFLTPYPLQEAPSQRFRFEQYFPLLEEKGYKILCQSFWDEQTWAILYKPAHTGRKLLGFLNGIFNRVRILFQLSKINFVFIHRECLPVGPPVVEWVIAKILKKKIIYDFDDAIWLPNTSEENKVVTILKWHGKVRSICQWSYKVSCGNSFLANYARQFNQNVVINPTTIDTLHLHSLSLYSPTKKNSSVIIGWTGTHSTLPYLQTFIPVFEKLRICFPGIRLLVIANKNPRFNSDHIDFVQWSKQTEIEDLLKIDIGIMPLSDDQWAKGKCGFKALQYMALEIPTLASPVGVNTEIIEPEITGYLCSKEEDWLQTLEKLLCDAELRKAIGAAGRKKVISNYSVSSNSSNLIRLFS